MRFSTQVTSRSQWRYAAEPTATYPVDRRNADRVEDNPTCLDSTQPQQTQTTHMTKPQHTRF